MLKEGISIEDVIRISSINREELEEKIDNFKELIEEGKKRNEEKENKLLAQHRYYSAMEGNREYEKMEMAKEMLKEGISIEDVIRISSINREELEEKIDNIEELIEEGNKKREEKEKIILAKKLLEKNMSIEEISEILKIDKQKIKDLKQKN